MRMWDAGLIQPKANHIMWVNCIFRDAVSVWPVRRFPLLRFHGVLCSGIFKKSQHLPSWTLMGSCGTMLMAFLVSSVLSLPIFLIWAFPTLSCGSGYILGAAAIASLATRRLKPSPATRVLSPKGSLSLTLRFKRLCVIEQDLIELLFQLLVSETQ